MTDGVRLTQGYVDVLTTPAGTKGVRLTQAFMSVLTSPATAKTCRATNVFMEILVPKDYTSLRPRMTQIFIEELKSKEDVPVITAGSRRVQCNT